jgi:hypothetical protein
VIDKVGSFGDELCNIFGMALAILDTGHVIVAAAGKIIVERDDLVAIFNEALA